jgi:hypothetical protein
MAALLGMCVLLAGTTAASAQEHTPPPWFGGRVEMPDFALTMPDDWVAFDVDRDLDAQAESFARLVNEASGGCDTLSCEADVKQELQDEEETVRVMAFHVPDDWASGPADDVDECRVHGPGSVGSDRFGELAGILHDVFEQSDTVDSVELPRALSGNDGSDYQFDFSALEGEVVGTVHVIGGDGKFAWISCEGEALPADRWRSIVETFEFLPADEPATVSAVPDLQATLPIWVDGRPLLSYSERGLDYLRNWSRSSDEMLLKAEKDPQAFEERLPTGVVLDDIHFANAGRASVDDPPYFVTAFRMRGIPAHTLPLEMVVAHPEAGTWSVRRFGDRIVRVGTEEMLDQSKRPGRPYVYDVGEVRFVVTTGDDAWAAEAIARLRPDGVIENAPLLVSLPDTWRSGYAPTIDAETVASAYESGILAAAHDGSRLDQAYIPTLEVHYTQTRLDADVAGTLERWADEYPDEPLRGRTRRSLERVDLPPGQALRLELAGEAGEPPFTVSEIRYLVATPAGVFDLLFSAAATDLPDYEAVFDEMARSFLQADPSADGTLARLGRGELTRAEYELLAGGYTMVPEHATSAAQAEATGPVALGGRIEVPAGGFALDVPEDWYAIDLAHPDVAEALASFDRTTRNFGRGRLTPENALRRGAFATFGEGQGGFLMSTAEDLAAGRSSSWDLVAFEPWDGAQTPNNCIAYGWDAPGTSVQDEATVTAQALRDSDYEVALDEIQLPVGNAIHIAGTNERWATSVFIVEHDDYFQFLECGHHQRHDQQWQAIAESLEFPGVES